MKKTFGLLLILAVAFTFAITSCKKEDSSPVPINNKAVQHTSTGSSHRESKAAIIQTCGTSTVVELVAGQNINAGTVTVSNDASNLFVTYATTGSWTLQELHLYAGDCALIPVNGSGNPVPGHFPYATNLSGNVQHYTFTIPLAHLPACFCVAAHAVVSSNGGTQTAWGAGTRFVSRGNWGTYFSVCKQSCGVCISSPDLLFAGEGAWPNGATSVVVGGYTYTAATSSYVYFSSASDSRTALILIATLKIYGTTISPPSSVLTAAATVEAWLAGLGQLNSNSQFTAPANVETAIANVQAWESSQYCQ